MNVYEIFDVWMLGLKWGMVIAVGGGFLIAVAEYYWKKRK